MQEAETVTLIQTAIRGAQPDPNKFSLSDFGIQQDEKGNPVTLTCPQGQTILVTPGRTTGWQVRFDPALCSTCPFQLEERCRTQPQKQDPRYLLSFTSQEVRSAKRRQDYLAHTGDSHNLRSAVEATVRSVKHPFPAGKMPVRGQFRVTCLAIAAAATANVRRIQRYLVAKKKAILTPSDAQSKPDGLLEAGAVSFFAFIRGSRAHWLRASPVFSPSFGC